MIQAHSAEFAEAAVRPSLSGPFDQVPATDAVTCRAASAAALRIINPKPLD